MFTIINDEMYAMLVEINCLFKFDRRDDKLVGKCVIVR